MIAPVEGNPQASANAEVVAGFFQGHAGGLTHGSFL
jgi:hypothetical protein